MNLHLSPFEMAAKDMRDVMGTRVASLRREEAVELLRSVVRQRHFTRLAFLNAHNANTACEDAEFARALDGFLVLPDGIGVDIASRMLYGETFPANLNGTDFIPQLLRSLEEPIVVAMVGARPDNARSARDRLQAMTPQHRFVFVRDGYFDADLETAILDDLAELKPDILLVAMGVPRQELWISRKIAPEHCTLAIGVGALFDFLSGDVPRAPKWMRRLRMEWVYRLLLEPKRLWRRYILGNPLFLYRVLRQKMSADSLST
jgi:exopolysaccharide biosynthesis WecB/TagA/CpsF family protein